MAVANNDKSQKISDLEEQLRDLKKSEKKPTPVGKKSSGSSKNIINITFVVIGLVGIAGSFIDQFDMQKYTDFLNVFAIIFAPLVITVGGGMAFKNYTLGKFGPKE